MQGPRSPAGRSPSAAHHGGLSARWVRQPVRVGHNLITTIDEADAAHGISWATDLISGRVAEEYALGATTLEDVCIRLTGHTSADDG